MAESAATRDECPDCGCDRSQGKTRNCSGCVEDWPARSAAYKREKQHFYISRWRVRIGKFGVGWRSASRSKWFRGAAFRFQREPVVVLRAFSFWIQWGKA